MYKKYKLPPNVRGFHSIPPRSDVHQLYLMTCIHNGFLQTSRRQIYCQKQARIYLSRLFRRPRLCLVADLSRRLALLASPCRASCTSTSMASFATQNLGWTCAFREMLFPLAHTIKSRNAISSRCRTAGNYNGCLAISSHRWVQGAALALHHRIHDPSAFHRRYHQSLYHCS